MNSRWKMNRIGFVNFWLYDEEDFEFVNGKLLLRGQNASGKSITTQSFIPFILDGDRTPSRLDPFGSSDRRMEYYFLGEEGKEESTGYLFLEFKKESTKEYRTIGIGQRAKRGKPMDFWGFVILDGQRIGVDFQLYKEIGSSKIPLDKREMKTALGEANFFTVNQSEYKKAVNQYVFGFRKAEQYEQFIKLLVKVRAPKLSKEFKPTKVYEILNDSLQTLTDEDLRAMVDAMEKMDEIQDSLEMLKRAFEDVKIIRNEYTRYNQYMLAKKAQAYMKMKKKCESEQERLNEQEKKKQETEEFQKNKTCRLEELEKQKSLKMTERNGLLDTDLEEIDRKLEQAAGEQKEAAQKAEHWENKIQECKEKIWQGQSRMNEIQRNLEHIQKDLLDAKEELEEKQEILQWERHKEAVQIIDSERYEESIEIAKALELLKKLIAECKMAICEYEEVSRQYDEAAKQLEELENRKREDEQALENAQEMVLDCMDTWITDLYEAEKSSLQWKPKQEVLQKAEEKIREYQSASDAEKVQELLRVDYESQRQILLDAKRSLEYENTIRKRELDQAEEALAHFQNLEELEPARDANMEKSRVLLREAGISAVPFYKTVEFAESLDERACARLEAQLEKMGILDALVVSSDDFQNLLDRCPGFLDTVLYVKERGNSDFDGLTVNEELETGLKESVCRILSNIYADEEHGQGIYLGRDGRFCQGVLAGKAEKDGGAEFVGVLARKRRKEQKIQELTAEIQKILESMESTEKEIAGVQVQIEQLQEEYQRLPGFVTINTALDRENECRFRLEKTCEEWEKKETQKRKLEQEKSGQYQKILQKCKPFPYGRTKDAYEEVSEALEEYGHIWQEIRQQLLLMKNEQSKYLGAKDRVEQAEQMMDDAFVEHRSYRKKVEECEIRIRQWEEYLNSPEIVEKAGRLKQLRQELEAIETERGKLKDDLATLKERLRVLQEEIPALKESLQKTIMTETALRTYFEEELALKLVFEREGLGLSDCARKAAEALRENDKNREPTDMLQALHQVYLRHNGSLVNYGTSLEECFEAPEAALEQEVTVGAVRKRVRVISVWNGKKVSLEEFYGILKQAIDETELLIQKKDRELFEDILSQTISRQLTDRIAESRKWVSDMSQLMKEMDTSMGLIFSLDWKPSKAENDRELDTVQLEQILLRDRTLLTMEDIEKVAAHFRSKIRTEKQKLEESGSMINYMELVREALDYRRWFEFHMYFKRGEGERKLLTNSAFNQFSGGEKAMAMYVPLFAAVNAQYKKAENEDHPRIIALDEAFAGVDDKNISSMFELVHKLDFDYIMNSQALWGCFETVKGLRIAELSRPQDSKIVSVIRYTWNGHERVLDVQ